MTDNNTTQEKSRTGTASNPPKINHNPKSVETNPLTQLVAAAGICLHNTAKATNTNNNNNNDDSLDGTTPAAYTATTQATQQQHTVFNGLPAAMHHPPNSNLLALNQVMRNPDLARALALSQLHPVTAMNPPAMADQQKSTLDLLTLALLPGLAGQDAGASAAESLQRLGLQQLTATLLQQQQQQPLQPPIEQATMGFAQNNTAAASTHSNGISTSTANTPLSTTSIPSILESGSNPPGTMILPCRARGMPVDHNFRVRAFSVTTQCFDIYNSNHLFCSFVHCERRRILLSPGTYAMAKT